MNSLLMPRRRFLACLVGLVAAPAVVKASSLMKVAAQPALRSLTIHNASSQTVYLTAYGLGAGINELLDNPTLLLEGHIHYAVRTILPSATWRVINKSGWVTA